MKIGLIPVNVGVSHVDQMVAIARKAEEVGVESVWTFEHVIVPVDYESKYPYAPSGKMGAQPDTNFVDPLIALTAVAASTSKIRLGTGVNILSQGESPPARQAGRKPRLGVPGPLHARRRDRLAARGVPRDGNALRAPRRSLR